MYQLIFDYFLPCTVFLVNKEQKHLESALSIALWQYKHLVKKPIDYNFYTSLV